MSVEIQEKVDLLGKQIKDAREASDKKNTEEFQKLANASADTLIELNKLKDERDKQAKAIEDLEMKLSRVGGSHKVETAPLDVYRKQFDSFLRRRLSDKHIPETIMSPLLDWAIDNSKALCISNKTDSAFIKKDVIEGIDPQGGYWILPEHSPKTVDKFYESNPLRQMASVMTTGTNLVKMIIDDNLSTSGGWVGEIEARTTTATAKIGEVDIPIHEQFAEPQVSHWMLDDVPFDLVGWVTNKTMQIFNLFENSAFIFGSGSKKPRGILTYEKWGGAAVTFGNDSNYEREKLEYIKTGSDTAVTYNSYVNLQLSLLEQYQPTAQFLMTRKTWAETLQIKDTQDRPLYALANLLADGANQVLLGKNVRIASPTQTIKQADEDFTLTGMGQVGDGAGTAVAIYGDFTGYTIVDRLGFVTITDIFTEKQFVKYNTRKRLGGALTSYQSLKVLETSA